VNPLVLRNGRAGVSALDLATEPLAEFGSLQAIASARLEELTRWPGVGQAKAAGLIAAFRLGRRSEHVDGVGEQLRDPEDVARIACQEQGQEVGAPQRVNRPGFTGGSVAWVAR